MAGFIPFSYADGMAPPVEYLPAGAITPKCGLALAMDGATGLLKVSTSPQYICMQEGAAVTAGTVIPVIRINDKIRFRAELDGACTKKAGSLIDVSTDGMQIDADAATQKVFLLEEMDGAAQGSEVRGRFVRADGVVASAGT